MKSYKELIKECPELGERLADIINDISCLQNSMPNIQDPAKPRELPEYTAELYRDGTFALKEENKWVLTQWNKIQQLRGLVKKLQRDLNEHLDKSKKKSTYKYE